MSGGWRRDNWAPRYDRNVHSPKRAGPDPNRDLNHPSADWPASMAEIKSMVAPDTFKDITPVLKKLEKDVLDTARGIMKQRDALDHIGVKFIEDYVGRAYSLVRNLEAIQADLDVMRIEAAAIADVCDARGVQGARDMAIMNADLLKRVGAMASHAQQLHEKSTRTRAWMDARGMRADSPEEHGREEHGPEEHDGCSGGCGDGKDG